MSESTATKSNVFKEDMALAIGGTGADETGSRRTSTGGTVSLTKLDASHLKFKTLAKSVDDLVDGGKDVTIKPLNVEAGGTLHGTGATLTGMNSAGIVKNNASGLLSGGNTVDAADMPSGIDAAKIADGSVSNTEFQYIGTLTSNAQTQINAKLTSSFASEVEQEAGTESAKVISPATQKFHPSAAKAWVEVTGAGSPAPEVAFNIPAIGDDGTGKFTVNFTVPFTTGNYAAAQNCRDLTGGSPAVQIDLTTGAMATDHCHVRTVQYDNSAIDISYWSMVFFGEQ